MTKDEREIFAVPGKFRDIYKEVKESVDEGDLTNLHLQHGSANKVGTAAFVNKKMNEADGKAAIEEAAAVYLKESGVDYGKNKHQVKAKVDEAIEQLQRQRQLPRDLEDEFSKGRGHLVLQKVFAYLQDSDAEAMADYKVEQALPKKLSVPEMEGVIKELGNDTGTKYTAGQIHQLSANRNQLKGILTQKASSQYEQSAKAALDK
jgi:hypothetical protein